MKPDGNWAGCPGEQFSGLSAVGKFLLCGSGGLSGCLWMPCASMWQARCKPRIIRRARNRRHGKEFRHAI